MEEYLEEYGYNGIYTRLEKTEGPFVNLDDYIESYEKRGANVRNVDWTYTDSDISDLKRVCFDYIRARYEGKEFRDIAKTGKEGSIFFFKNLWDAFLEEHQTNTPADEETVQELREKYPTEDLSILLKRRDNDWIEQAKGHLKACHNAIYMERSFNAAHFVQSKDRIHRYGLAPGTETNYYYVLSRDSVDETVDIRLSEKERRMTEIMESMPIPLFNNVSDDFGDEDIKALIRDYVRRTKKA